MSDLYQKIPGLFKREEVRPFKLLEGVYREPELELLKDIEWVFTEKVDGTNIRVIWDGLNTNYPIAVLKENHLTYILRKKPMSVKSVTRFMRICYALLNSICGFL